MPRKDLDIVECHCDQVDMASRAVWVGFWVNLFLAGFKLFAGIVGASSAMIADAFHSLSDILTDVVVLVSIKFSRRPPDETHDYGHGKIETVAATVVGIVLFGVGFEILYSAGRKIYAALAEGIFPGVPGGIALAAAVISIALKEGLYHYSVRVATKTRSSAVYANAWHHRTDSLSSVAAMFGIGGAMIFGARWTILDPAAAFVVGFFVLWAAVRIFAEGMGELLEKSLDPQTEQEILDIISAVEGVRDPHNLRTRKIGAAIAIDVHIRVPPAMTVLDAHRINDEIEARLRQRFGENTIINIHTEPDEA